MVAIDELEAVIQLKLDMTTYALENWPGIARKLNEMFRFNPKLPEDEQAAFLFFLAVLFVQSRAPYNIYSDEQGERLWQFLKNTFAAEPQFGAQSNGSLDIYHDVWNQQIEAKQNPFGGVASVLLYCLGYKEQSADEFITSVLSNYMAMTPPWWKNFSGQSELTRSHMPINRDDFLRFAAEAERG